MRRGSITGLAMAMALGAIAGAGPTPPRPRERQAKLARRAAKAKRDAELAAQRGGA